jgi:hypothetical protein
MKTKLVLTVVSILICATAFASDIRLEVINQQNPEIFRVIYAGEKARRVKLTILDSNNVVVFTETSPRILGFIRNVNFANMQPGEYTVQVVAEKEVESRVIKYVGMTSVEAIVVSKTAEAGKYLLSVKNKRPETLSVRIFDGTDQLVHKQQVTSNGNLKMVYNLKAVTGVPTFEVVDRSGVVKVIRY